MKMKDFPSVKQAALVAKAHLAYHEEMMRQKETHGETKMKKLFIVDTIIAFKHRYVIEADDLEHAFDEVTMIDSGNPSDRFDELDQEFLGETIFDGRKISRKQFRKMIEEMEANNKGNAHLGERIIRKIDYDTPR